jgi:hypothetical protein
MVSPSETHARLALASAIRDERCSPVRVLGALIVFMCEFGDESTKKLAGEIDKLIQHLRD